LILIEYIDKISVVFHFTRKLEKERSRD